jgi:hypothetical protein
VTASSSSALLPSGHRTVSHTTMSKLGPNTMSSVSSRRYPSGADRTVPQTSQPCCSSVVCSLIGFHLYDWDFPILGFQPPGSVLLTASLGNLGPQRLVVMAVLAPPPRQVEPGTRRRFHDVTPHYSLVLDVLATPR